MLCLIALHLLGQGAPKVFIDVLGSVMTETVEVVILYPIHGSVGEGFHHSMVRKFPGWKEGVEPGSKSVLIPFLRIHSAIGQIKWSSPFGLLLVERMVLVHMMRNIVQYNIHVVGMRCLEQFIHGRFVSKTIVDVAQCRWPVPVVCRERTLHAIIPQSPGSFGISRNGRNPDGVDAQLLEIAVFNLLRYTLQVTAQVVGFRVYG